MKKLIALILIICTVFTLAACGSTSYGVKSVQTLVSQDYSLAFRTNDPIYFYVVGALQVLTAEGKVDELAVKWLGSPCIEFDPDITALDDYAVPVGKTMIIGVDINSFPFVYLANDTFWGFDIELAQAVADKLNWELKAQSIEKENVYNELASGNIDVAWGGIALNRDEINEGKYIQYGPYIHNDIVIAARDSAAIWNSFRLKNKTMAMPATPEARDALEGTRGLSKDFSNVIRLVGGTLECFEYLYANKCDVILTDSTAIQYYNCH